MDARMTSAAGSPPAASGQSRSRGKERASALPSSGSAYAQAEQQSTLSLNSGKFSKWQCLSLEVSAHAAPNLCASPLCASLA